MFISVRIAIITLLLPLLSRGADDWQTVIADTFTLGTQRAAGSPLAGSSTQTGNRRWRSYGNDALFVVTANEQVGSGNAQGGKTAALLDCVPTGEYRIRLEADLQPGRSMWLAAGFSAGQGLFWDPKAPGQLWLTINGSRTPASEGSVDLYANATKTLLARVPAKDYGFDAAKPVHVVLTYDKAANTVSLSLNDKPVLAAKSLGDFHPDLKSVGLMTNFPAANDAGLAVDSFRISLQNGALAEPQAAVKAGRPLFILQASAAPRSNLTRNKDDLRIENSWEPPAPYYAEFDFAVKPEDAGDYQAWVLLLACEVPYISPWAWSLDRAPLKGGTALEGSLAGMPRWVRFAQLPLAAGVHTLRFEVAGRRSFPDDSYLFHLYRVILAPAEETFSPGTPNVELGFNPQAQQQDALAAAARPGAAGEAARDGRLAIYRSDVADPVYLRVDWQQELPPVQPVWRDLSEGGIETGGDFILPRYVAPLRPRFIRKCHVLSLSEASIKRHADGTLTCDFTPSVAAARAILAVGAEPILDLANPPAVIRKGIAIDDWPTHAAFQREWAQVVTAFLQALKDNQLPVKYFSCFNEPEFSGLRTRGHDAAALAVYRVAATAVKAFDPALKMAGMEFGNAKSDIYRAFLDEIAPRPDSVDVFSFHQYNSTPARYAQEIKDLRQELDRRSLGHVRIAIDEWGLASGGEPRLRSGVRAATHDAACLKAMAEAGLDIGGHFGLRDYPNAGWQWGTFTGDGFFKPAYWGLWLWAQLPETQPRLAIGGENEVVQAVAFRDGEGLAILLWYNAPETAPIRKVTVALAGVEWPGYAAQQWQLDAMRHVGYIPEDRPVELPHADSSDAYPTPRAPSIVCDMLPPSMRLIRLRPLAPGEAAVPPRPLLLDHAKLSNASFRQLAPRR